MIFIDLLTSNKDILTPRVTMNLKWYTWYDKQTRYCNMATLIHYEYVLRLMMG